MSNDFLSRLQAAKTDEEREWVVLEFSLQNLEKVIQDAVWASAIPHWFDTNFLAALLQKSVGQVESIYKRMQGLSFVEVFPNRGQNIHERTRKLLLKRLWEQDVEKYRELSRRAAEYSGDQDQADVGWRVEWIYHLLISEPDDAASRIQGVGWEWNNAFAYGNVETLVRAALEHAQGGRLSARCLAWVQYWDALVELDYFRYSPALEKFSLIKLPHEDDNHLNAETNIRMGAVYIILGEYEKAKNCLKKALPICRETNYRSGEAHCLFSLGDVHLRLSEYEESRKYYEQALAIYEELSDLLGQASSTQMMGFVDKLTGQVYSASEALQKAMALQKEIGDRVGEYLTLIYMGDIDRTQQNLSEAEKKYREALAYYQSANVHYNSAVALFRLGDLAVAKTPPDLLAARKYLQEALEIFTQTGSPYAASVKEALDSLSPDSD